MNTDTAPLSKQVIVMRKMPKGQRHGKYCAQAAHASMAALLSMATNDGTTIALPMSNKVISDWINGSYTKVVLQVDTEEQLKDVYAKASDLGLPCALVIDNGLTEYNGVKTATAVGIGPAAPELIDRVTGDLKLF